MCCVLLQRKERMIVHRLLSAHNHESLRQSKRLDPRVLALSSVMCVLPLASNTVLGVDATLGSPFSRHRCKR